MNLNFPEWTKGRVTNINLRPETHGDQKVMAIDFTLQFDCPNTILNELADGLLEAWYWNKAGNSGQESIAGVVGILPDLRFPEIIQPLKFNKVLQGFKFENDYGLGQEAGSNIILDTCRVKKITANCKQGGTTTLEMMVQASMEDLEPEAKGRLTDLPAKPVVEFRLIAPAVPQETTDTEDEEGAARGRQTPAQALQAQLGMDAGAGAA